MRKGNEFWEKFVNAAMYREERSQLEAYRLLSEMKLVEADRCTLSVELAHYNMGEMTSDEFGSWLKKFHAELIGGYR